MSRNQIRHQIWATRPNEIRPQQDYLAVEEPLEIRVQAGSEQQTLAVTMRTPGNDFELAAGFLFAEGVINHPQDIVTIRYCVGEVDEPQQYNVLRVVLRRPHLPSMPQLERHFFTSSACGVCGKAALEALELRSVPPIPPGPTVDCATLYNLPGKLKAAQTVFEQTGGLHAAGLFSPAGELLLLREDVGRHNALDKLLGAALLKKMLPWHRYVLLVSGRASFELLQKCLVGGGPIFCAVSAPSSLAVSLAERFNITLVGFLRPQRCNIYTHPARILSNLGQP